jgi:hypothetical protein
MITRLMLTRLVLTRLAARLLALLCAVVLTALAPTAGAPSATATSRWAPVATAKIHPGVQMFTDGAQCTANFVFTDARNRVYVGYAAHCAGTGGASDTNGCETGSLPYGTRVRFATRANLLSGGTTVGYGRLVYSSWRNMQARRVTAANPCAYNDFALVRVGADYVRTVNPSVPVFGGPRALDTDGVAVRAAVYSYGSSSLRGSAAKRGTVIENSGGGWTHEVRTGNPGIPGDSGSGFLGPDGRALGVLSTLNIGLLPSNGVGDLYRELRYAQRWSGIAGLRLVPGTKAFSAP